MPELGEVAHATALLRKHILNKTLTKVSATQDDLLFVKPLSHEAFMKTAEGAQVTGIARNGKYFMVELGGQKTLVLHFGMTGWIHVRNVGTLIRMEGGGDKRQKDLIEKLKKEGKDPKTAQEFTRDWPPRFTKFTMTTDAGDELAFIDPRRLARIRLLDVPQSKANELEPLSKLGTDFSQEQPPSTSVVPLILRRRVPVKSLLLDQSLFSGIGNWMADEILYQARIHPEQYSDTLGTKNATHLYDKLLEVSRIAAETEGNSAAFPPHWLMLHRWGKSRSKKEVQKTVDGHIVSFVTVGGRTSCFVPTLQKKFKPVTAADEEEEKKKKESMDGDGDTSNENKRLKKEEENEDSPNPKRMKKEKSEVDLDEGGVKKEDTTR